MIVDCILWFFAEILFGVVFAFIGRWFVWTLTLGKVDLDNEGAESALAAAIGIGVLIVLIVALAKFGFF